MLEVWADIYELTNNVQYMLLAERYWNNGWYKQLDSGKDTL